LARGLARRSERLKTLSPIVIAVAVVGLWSLIGRFSTPDSLRQENGEMLIEAIRTNLLTDLFGRTLSPSALALIVIMVAGGLCGAWRLRSLAWPVRRHPASIRPASDADWAEAAMTVFVLFSAAWFALISIGWPRYAYAGVNVALLLLGKTAWDLFQAVRKRVAHARPAIARRAYPLALTGLVIGGVLTNVYPVLQFDKDSQAQQAVAYLDANVPPGAVIETWDWELSALSLHSEFHHPHQRYLFEAIRQFSHDQIAFDLNYDLLQEDPDYLVLGPFSIWSHIYNDHDVDRYFVELTHIGDYEIYRRIR
jgi:hypothetical protein